MAADPLTLALEYGPKVLQALGIGKKKGKSDAQKYANLLAQTAMRQNQLAQSFLPIQLRQFGYNLNPGGETVTGVTPGSPAIGALGHGGYLPAVPPTSRTTKTDPSITEDPNFNPMNTNEARNFQASWAESVRPFMQEAGVTQKMGDLGAQYAGRGDGLGAARERITLAGAQANRDYESNFYERKHAFDTQLGQAALGLGQTPAGLEALQSQAQFEQGRGDRAAANRQSTYDKIAQILLDRQKGKAPTQNTGDFPQGHEPLPNNAPWTPNPDLLPGQKPYIDPALGSSLPNWSPADPMGIPSRSAAESLPPAYSRQADPGSIQGPGFQGLPPNDGSYGPINQTQSGVPAFKSSSLYSQPFQPQAPAPYDPMNPLHVHARLKSLYSRRKPAPLAVSQGL